MKLNEKALEETLTSHPSRLTKSGLAELALAVKIAWEAEREAIDTLQDLALDAKYLLKHRPDEAPAAKEKEAEHRQNVWYPAYCKRQDAIENLNRALGTNLRA